MITDIQYSKSGVIYMAEGFEELEDQVHTLRKDSLSMSEKGIKDESDYKD